MNYIMQNSLSEKGWSAVTDFRDTAHGMQYHEQDNITYYAKLAVVEIGYAALALLAIVETIVRFIVTSSLFAVAFLAPSGTSFSRNLQEISSDFYDTAGSSFVTSIFSVFCLYANTQYNQSVRSQMALFLQPESQQA